MRNVSLWLGSAVLVLGSAAGAIRAGIGQENPGQQKQAAKEPVAKLPAAVKRKVDFVKDVQPLLRKNCYSCHGPEEQEGGLRLDNKARAFEGGDEGKVIVAGRSADSRLVQLVAGTDPDQSRMPPDGEGTPLTAEQIGILRAWIDQGATWPATADEALSGADHWSFQPLRRPSLPHGSGLGPVVNPIDRFIQSRLAKEGLKPSPAAERATLIRRLYLDLLGLPPSVAEVDAFLSDSHPGAYERLVDRVLASPHYGERWGRHWLDVARYADSDGYEKDRARPFAWRYRSWVIEALNRDLAFDRFSTYQLAGDLIPHGDGWQRTATGFHRNTLHNTEGGTDREEDRVKKTVDRTNTFGTIWLGLTVGCAQCHTHKYDPLTQREYYSLYSFFNHIDESDPAIPTAMQRQAYETARLRHEAAHAPLVAAVRKYETERFAAAQQAWEAAQSPTATWHPLADIQLESLRGADFERQNDGSFLVVGKNEKSDIYTLTAALPVKSLTAVRLEVLPDKRLPKNGPGRAANGNFVLSTVRLAWAIQDSQAAAADAEAKASGDDRIERVALKPATARADFAQKEWPVIATLNESPADGWAVSPQIGKRHVAIWELDAPAEPPPNARLVVTLDQTYKGDTHNLGRFRVSVSSAARPVPFEGLSATIVDALAVPQDKRTDKQRKRLADYYRPLDKELAKLQKRVDEHAAKAPKPAADAKVQAVVERSQPRKTQVHIRGNFLEKGDEVSTVVPRVLPELPKLDGRPTRLDLARWLFSTDHPLTARVTVNRVWQRIFGIGLVRTSDDFGKQGEPPSHPQLLDWLAVELRDSGWSLKHLQRQIVLSHTYRQSPAVSAEMLRRDPDNRLLARQSRRRVEAEIVRDLALSVSGLLDNRLGGPSVRPAQPAEYSKLTYANSAKWQVSSGGDAYRRGLYTFFQRTSPYPMLMTFDATDSNACTAQRSESNTPLQALTLWNDPVFLEAAQVFGRRIVRETPASTSDVKATAADRARAVMAFRTCLARRPADEEIAAVLRLLNRRRDYFQSDQEAAKALIGGRPVPPHTSAAELAAWIIVARGLINLDEFLTRE